MGLGIFRSTSGCGCETTLVDKIRDLVGRAPPPGTPNPRRFEILRSEEFGPWTVVEVKYIGATNYEGRKVLVFDVPLREVKSCRTLDPHFCESTKHLSPVARFEPTMRGWLMAKIAAVGMGQAGSEV